ncbi:AzlD domain-containing protein [Ancylobacter lacus]|uniref:AzlD domain-containing protein n=1 Tax=Ancylobacter lacus TaxID=2579970 RepID=UPI001BCA9C4E|nr:AzlD domain-containing protein [Ancylobacter lacus]MBS7540882.1 AzlD domain-containing protein [Ancylobacter lacus]
MNLFGGEWNAVLVVLLVGFLPNEVWRVLGVVIGRGLDENGAVMRWVRAVATALLAAVVARLVLTPSGALAALPLWLRLGALVVGIGGFVLSRRSVLVGVLAAQATLIGGAWWLGLR